MNTARTIQTQLGGALVMIGAKNLIAHSDALSFRIGRNRKRVNHVKVTHNPGVDLYTVTFSRVPSVRALCRGAEVVVVAESVGVYASQLKDVIETHTGLYTRL
jgi:hypothetical protein|tara:strand:- start:503 stop:811 length:309 start_codon:yes stop_codon:yes gene_type:complete